MVIEVVVAEIVAAMAAARVANPAAVRRLETGTSLSKVPTVLFQTARSLTTVVPGPNTPPPEENAEGGAGDPDRLPQRVLGGKTPVHCAQARLGRRTSAKIRNSFFMGLSMSNLVERNLGL